MKLKIAIAVAALCWPLLATAAPALLPVSVPECCRRGGEHHCMARPAIAAGQPAIGGVCPHLARACAISAAPYARAILTFSAICPQVAKWTVAGHSRPAANSEHKVLSSRAPPRA